MSPERRVSLNEIRDLLVGHGVDPDNDTPKSLDDQYKSEDREAPTLTVSGNTTLALVDEEDQIDFLKHNKAKRTPNGAFVLTIPELLAGYQKALKEDAKAEKAASKEEKQS